MTVFWIVAALLAALAIAFVVTPLLRWRRTRAEVSRPAANASIYREQLEELEADARRGAITREEFERASREIERRVLAEHVESGAFKPHSFSTPRIASILVAILLPLFAALGYWQLGNPGAIGPAPLEGAHAVTREQMESLVARLDERMRQTPNDAEGWMLLGRSFAVLGQYERSAQAYARAVALAPKDAGLLADYADVLAMARGQKLAGEPFDLAKRALELDPVHVKALALAGSAEFERGDFAAAIAYWEKILKVAPPESEFARSVVESIAEARSLGGKAPAAKVAASKKDLSLQGIVTLDPAVAARASPGDTVFVLARPASGSRMPLAIARTTVAALPYRFALDDSMAMAPGATISSHAKIVVAARVSKSGNAAPQKGDLEGASATVAPGASGVAVVISRVVD